MMKSTVVVFSALLVMVVCQTTKSPISKKLIRKPMGLMKVRPSKLVRPTIIGGEVAPPGLIKYQAAISITDKYGDKYFCGGSLIHGCWVLTAAHCADIGVHFEVRFGSTSPNSGGTTYNTTYKVLHPAFNRETLNHDIALLGIAAPGVSITSAIQVVKMLPRFNICPPEVLRQFRISGWGRKSDSDPFISSVLMYATVNEITDLNCTYVYDASIIIPTVICAKGSKLESSCNGDSGGPMVLLGTPDLQVGVVSFGHVDGCGLGYPAGFTEVAPYIDWISFVTKITFL